MTACTRWGNMFMSTSIDVCACMHVYVFAECAHWLCSRFVWMHKCVCVCLHERETERWWKCYDSAWRLQQQQQQQQPPRSRVDGGRGWGWGGGVHEARHLFFFFSQNELWNKAKCVLFSIQQTETKAKHLWRDWVGLVLQKVLDNKISRVRRHEGYECLFTLIDSLMEF